MKEVERERGAKFSKKKKDLREREIEDYMRGGKE